MTLNAATISQTLRAPAGQVGLLWPLMVAALQEFGIDSPMVQVAAAATVMVECPGWIPCREKHADPNRQPEIWREQERYWHTGFFGRGLIQTTLEGNYVALGKALGLDLRVNPDALLDPRTAARAMAYFFATHGVKAAADARDWLHVRIHVNGIDHATGFPNGWPTFQKFALALVAEVGNA